MTQFSRQTQGGRKEGGDHTTEDVDPLLLLSLSSSSASPSSSSSSLCPFSALELLEVLWLYRDVYEDECQVKRTILSSLLSSAQSSLSTASSSPPLLAASHSNWQLMWRAQVGLDQQRIEEGRERLRRDAEWRKKEGREQGKEMEVGEGGGGHSRGVDSPHQPHPPQLFSNPTAIAQPQPRGSGPGSGSGGVESHAKKKEKGKQKKKKKK